MHQAANKNHSHNKLNINELKRKKTFYLLLSKATKVI